MKRSVRILWILFSSGFLLFVFLIFAYYFNLFGNMPPRSVVENPSAALSSEVFAADGSLLGRYYVQDRSSSKYSEISPNVFNALIATEDARFNEHSGIDGRAVLRAVFLLGREGGGSTITQQLAKNLFGRQNPNLFTLPFIKLKEWVLAVKLERRLTKHEIITLYLNTVPFSDNVYGIKNAALTFYNKTPDKLSVDEAAVLIGSLKGNSFYNPRRHPQRAKDRRNVVLGQMVKYGYLPEAEAKTLMAKETPLDYHKLDYHEGQAPYFRQVVEQEVKKICKDLKKADGSSYDIYKDGLKIYTTLNPAMQQYAEQAVEEHIADMQKLFVGQRGYKDGSVWKKHMDLVNRVLRSSDRYETMKEEGMSHEQIMTELSRPVKMRVFAWNKDRYKDTVMSPIDSVKYMRMFLQAGFMVMDPFTGEVKAWVGGVNHNYFQFDHVNENTKRQVGSTIKPLLYTLAVDNGISPCGIVSTSPQSFPTTPKPYDAGGSEFGPITMNKALAHSVNNAALYLLKQVGINAFVEFVHRSGINSTIEKYPSSALGVSDISLFEMLGAYTMFPTGGIHTQPVFISRIEDKHGNLLKSFSPAQKEIINPNTAYKMVKMMRGVVDNGTARRLRFRYNLQGEIAGKTGTTNNQADAWFIGYTPQLVAGAWVGCDDRFLRFRSTNLGQGASAALPIWALFMKKVYNDKSLNIDAGAKFEAPEGFDDCSVIDPTSEARAGALIQGSYDNQTDIDEVVPYVPDEWNPDAPQRDFQNETDEPEEAPLPRNRRNERNQDQPAQQGQQSGRQSQSTQQSQQSSRQNQQQQNNNNKQQQPGQRNQQSQPGRQSQNHMFE